MGSAPPLVGHGHVQEGFEVGSIGCDPIDRDNASMSRNTSVVGALQLWTFSRRKD